MPNFTCKVNSRCAKVVNNQLGTLYRRLEHLRRLYERSEVSQISWLDPLTLEHISDLHPAVCVCLTDAGPRMFGLLTAEHSSYSIIFRAGRMVL